MIGTVIDTVSFPVEEGKVREFARAAGSADLERVPLTFAVVAGHYRDAAPMIAALGLDLPRIVVGGCEWEYHTPVRVGDRLTGDRVVTGDELKKNGTMRVLRLETALHRQDGELAVVQRDTIIEVPRA